MKKTLKFRKHGHLSGFTLLELLVVVGILAIIAGAIVTAYQGHQRRASEAASMSSMKTLTQAILVYSEIEQEFPDNLETLLSAVPVNPQFDSSTLNTSVSEISTPREAMILSDQLKEAFEPRTLTTEQLDSLRAAGITQLRFIDQAGDNDLPSSLVIPDASGNTGKSVGPILEEPSSLSMFEIPSADVNNGQGRGYFMDVGPSGTYPTGLQLMVWGGQGTGAGGTTISNIFENTLVSADPDAVLVGLGVGKSCTLIIGRFRDSNASSDTILATAPFDAGQKVSEYQHYIMLFDVTESPARFVAVVDPNGVPLQQKSINSENFTL